MTVKYIPTAADIEAACDTIQLEWDARDRGVHDAQRHAEHSTEGLTRCRRRGGDPDAQVSIEGRDPGRVRTPPHGGNYFRGG